MARLIIACLFFFQIGRMGVVMKPAALPNAEGVIVEAAFSPDSRRLAVIRTVRVTGAPVRRVMQIVELQSGKEITKADVLNSESPNLWSSEHFISYSPDGRSLLLATEGSDVLSIIDATPLHGVKEVALHPEASARVTLVEGHWWFRAVVSLASSSHGDLFGVLTHDERGVNEMFIGSFSSGRIIKSWSLGKGGAAPELGMISPSLSSDGSRTAVSVLPYENNFPRNSDNVLIFDAASGNW